MSYTIHYSKWSELKKAISFLEKENKCFRILNSRINVDLYGNETSIQDTLKSFKK